MAEPLLKVEGLRKYFPIKSKGLLPGKKQFVRAVDDVSFFVNEGETFSLVGESGSGKSTIARLVIKLIEPTAGEIRFGGRDFTRIGGEELRQARKDMQMVFQDPYASLNPRMTVGEIVGEPLVIHSGLSRSQLDGRVGELLETVGLDAYHARRYPHEFSGGQRQRIGIARALALNPRLVIGDEPVSALDVSIQSQVLNLMKDLQDRFRLTYLFIAHNMSVVKFISDRIGVMYLGRIVELATKGELFARPLHPYTRALLSAVPVPDPDARRQRVILEGEIPSPSSPPSGCPFHTRCPMRADRCTKERPEWREAASAHFVSCHFA